MEAPMIVSLSRQMANRDMMQVLANNIANMTTGGFKGERLMFREYVARTPEGTAIHFPVNTGLYRDLSPGPFSKTHNPLDIALRGEGYLAVETPQGVRYTRNGHLTLDAEGQIVTSLGHPVLDDGNRPILIGPETRDITISHEGIVMADDQTLGRLQLVRFDAPQTLERRGGTLLDTDAEPLPAEDVEVLQGFLEGSNIQPILEMTRFMEIAGAYQSTQKMIDGEHERQRRAIEKLGTLPN